MAGLAVGICAKKGGSGKTTISVNLAGALAEFLKDVLIIDSDPQGTVLTWRAAIEDVRTLAYTDEFRKMVEGMKVLVKKFEEGSPALQAA